MRYYYVLFILPFLACVSCSEETISIENSTNGNPVVKSTATYSVVVKEDIVYAQGLTHNGVSSTTAPKPLLLDVYAPENSLQNRPVYVFIHGGGFKGGSKTADAIVNMGNYFAARGWVFVSIDYRVAKDIGTLYTGIVPKEWETAANNATGADVLQVLAMYTAQRDAKAAMRWVVANANTYNINTDFITVGGGSAGAITAIALGVSNEEDFRDEIGITEDPTLASTNLNESYSVKSIVEFWGTKVKLDVFELVYGLDRFDSNDPLLLIVHGTADENKNTPYSAALELQTKYNATGLTSELVSLEGAGHGAWNATVNGKSLSELSFEFLVQQQKLNVE